MTAVTESSRALIIMAKRPAAGATKTRLTPTLTSQQAADLYERLLLDTIDATTRRSDCAILIAVDEPESAGYFSTIAPGLDQVEQVGANLGDRLDAVLTAGLELGYQSVFAIGSDSPDLPSAHLDRAFHALDRDDTDVVVGPTEDGGYYLIGWKQRWSPLLTDVEMSTSRVLQDTLAVAESLRARVALAPSWYDVDTPDDLQRVRNSLAGSACHTAEFLRQL